MILLLTYLLLADKRHEINNIDFTELVPHNLL